MTTESVKWGEGKKQKAIDWLDFELTHALMARKGLERHWRNLLQQYRAPKRGTKEWPFPGAANYEMPLTATDVDQMYATFMQTVHAADNIWVLEPLNERWVDSAKPMQDFLAWLGSTVIPMYKVNEKVLLEMVKLGTGVYKTGWAFESRPTFIYDEQGKAKRTRKIKSAPFVDYVNLHDFVVPPSCTEIQPEEQGGAAWVAERIRISPERLRWLAKSQEPLYPSVDDTVLELVLTFEEAAQTEYKTKVQQLDYIKRSLGSVDFDRDGNTADSTKGPGGLGASVREIEIWEIHARVPTQGDGEDDIVLWYHQPTRNVLRAIYQPYLHGARPYEVVRYFPGEGFYGIGMAEQNEMFQSMLSDLYNFQQDNVLLANTRVFVAKEGSSVGPGELWYPGKTVTTMGDVRSDFAAFQLSDIYQSLPQLIGQVEAIRQRRNGVGDLQLGTLQSLPSRTPASTTQALLAEGKRRPDLTLKGLRYSGLAKVGLRLVQLLQQFAGKVKTDEVRGERWLQIAMDVLGSPEGQRVAEKLQLPMENAEFGLGVSIQAVSSTANKELQQERLQNLLALQGQTAQQYVQLGQLAMQAQGTPLGMLAIQLMQGINEIQKRLYEQHDIRNPETMVPDMAALQAPPPQPGPNQLSPGPQGSPAMAGMAGPNGPGVPGGNGAAVPGAVA